MDSKVTLIEKCAHGFDIYNNIPTFKRYIQIQRLKHHSIKQLFSEYPFGIFSSFQLVLYYRACGSYHVLFDRGLLLTMKLMNKRFLVALVEVITSKVLRSLVTTIIWITITGYLCYRWSWICSLCCNYNPFPITTWFMTRADIWLRKKLVTSFSFKKCDDRVGVA